MSIKSWLTNTVIAIGFFLTGILGAMASWDMISTLINAFDSTFLQGLWWITYVIILVIWTLVVPAYRLITAHAA